MSNYPEAEYNYTAIRLTNYYTNLLSKPETNELIDLKIIGSNWRTKQLTYQIPHQDIKLLASSSISSGDITNGSTNKQQVKSSSQQERSPRSGSSTKSQAEDEIDYIRSQRKLASQYKASLYYLNPQRLTAQSWSKKTATGRKVQQRPKDANENNNKEATQRRHHCLKCKLPIEVNTTCVRVDNLKVNFGDQLPGKKQVGKSKTSQKENDAISITETNKNRQVVARTNNLSVEDENKSQPSSSCDEGMGTSSSATSSGQSSTTGSHCDDRETPPHVVVVDEDQAQSDLGCEHVKSDNLRKSKDDSEKPKVSENLTDQCDNLKLSLDSLNIVSGFNNAPEQPKGLKYRRSRSNTLIGDELQSLQFGNMDHNNKRKRNRALTWTASLSNSIGASLKQLSSTKIGKGSKIDQTRMIEEDVDDTNDKTIFFHTDCFCCSTCKELLVDLRALIYMNEPVVKAQQSDLEYVNLPTATADTADSPKVDDESTAQYREQQIISLYCHRHFVELFKPRCQQCDCLILDEECTEAEGKVWHIKHFCCTECKVPLGGQQYIIVDQTQQTRARKQLQNQQVNGQKTHNLNCTIDAESDVLKQQNSPYCLRCFDQVFGETCEACKKLITCDLGAINHEQRCWHASPSCFRCRRCLRSLLGKPFLPSSDGHIYCSLQCSDSKIQKQPEVCQPKLSVAHYCDPRAPPSQQNQQAEEQQAGLLRHKPLIEYLLGNASVDETSCQLLRYLYNQFNNLLQQQHRNGSGSIELEEQRKLIYRIGTTLKTLDLQHQQKDNKNGKLPSSSSLDSIAARRNKLNPFLIDSFCSGGSVQDSAAYTIPSKLQQHDNVMSIVMDGLEEKLTASSCKSDRTLANYINLNHYHSSSSGNQVSSAVGIRKQHTDSVDNAQHILNSHLAPQQASLMALKLNSGKQSLTCKASQSSPAASLVSNEDTISDHSSATSSGVSTAPNVSQNGSLKSHSPLSNTSSHSSISGAHATRSPPPSTTTTTLAGRQMQINSVAAAVERRRRVQPITELSVVDLLSVADDQMHQQQQSHVAFDQLVSHFDKQRGNLQAQQPSSGAKQLGNCNKQQESFFHELAQRLPSHRKHQLSEQNGPIMPLDTIGLPTFEPQNDEGATRTITDHYSTVNKAHKLQPNNNRSTTQQVAAEKARESFFAITSPLLNCQTAEAPTRDTNFDQNGQAIRPSSSLSVLTAAPLIETASSFDQQQLQPSFSTASLLLQSTDPGLELGQQRLNSRPTKSVSFDPSVKDPASSSSMTLGRATALKSALKYNNQQWTGNTAAQYNGQFLATVGSSATLPSSLANQIKANAAYSALYDENGRRIKLSSLINQQQQLLELQEDPQTSSNKSIFSKLNFVSGQSSRGGRREERKLRQQNPQVVQAQPMSSVPSNQQLFVQPLDMQIPQQQPLYPIASTSTMPQQYLLERAPSTSGTHKTKRYRSRRRHQRTRSRSRRTHSSPPRRKCSSYSTRRRPYKYCTDTDCYDDEDSDDSSSHCSTCSSSSLDSSASESDDYTDDCSDDNDDYTSDTSYTSCSSYDSYSYSDTSRSISPCSSTRSGSMSARSPSPSPSEDSQKRSHGKLRPTRRARHGSSSSSHDRRHRRHHVTRSRSSRRRSPERNRASTRARSHGSRSSSNRSSSSRGSRPSRHEHRHKQQRSHHHRSHHRHQNISTTVSGRSSSHSEDTLRKQQSAQSMYSSQSQASLQRSSAGSVRAKSPSTMSTDSKLNVNNSENCRLI